MAYSSMMKNPAIECLLAMEAADLPAKPKVNSKDMLSAFVVALQKEVEENENRAFPDIFIEELKRLLASGDRPTSTQDLIETSRAALNDLKVKNTGRKEQSSQMLVLSLGVEMLIAKLQRDAINN